jgi:hypothetical protein
MRGDHHQLAGNKRVPPGVNEKAAGKLAVNPELLIRVMLRSI